MISTPTPRVRPSALPPASLLTIYDYRQVSSLDWLTSYLLSLLFYMITFADTSACVLLMSVSDPLQLQTQCTIIDTFSPPLCCSCLLFRFIKCNFMKRYRSDAKKARLMIINQKWSEVVRVLVDQSTIYKF